MSSSRDWYEELAELIKSRPEILEKLREKISQGSLEDYLKGRIKDINKINPGRRAFLYKVTGLESLHFEGYVDPENIDLNKIISGEQPASYLKIWVGLNGKTIVSFSKEAKVHEETVRKFIGGERLREEYRGKIISTLKKYAAGKQPEQTSQGSVNAANPSELDALASVVENLTREVRRLGGSYQPTERERMRVVNEAINTLYDQMVYYAEAPQDERNKLADSIDPDQWGLLVNVLGGIAKKADSPEVFGRAIISGNYNPRRRK